ncbi:uncharacterized protein LOC126377858 isoform X1 [Pectinophora gossypiella]|uniref:uncharacterized protein LOC126377858 isoform X1 n=1 Tax=Pectinophora gossypiella TaxID=13191 RepID=UPI00214EF293|nr:uncharacterized protein LOC126377858 isoform X1 [Pectinophora gossypiella]
MCFKNYEGPSTGMEADILVEGFERSQEMHGVKYLIFIGDGDSSVYAQLREKVSYGTQIKKIECKNHVIKNYTGALYKIIGNTKLPLFGRKILKPKLQKLTAVSRKIIMEADHNSMREDLKNGPSHVFGCHQDCKAYYCRFCQNSDEKDTNSLDDLKTKAPAVWAHICAANEAVMSKCHRLSNNTTNVVENFMSVVSKFVCGKRLSLYKGGSYQRRVYIAGKNMLCNYCICSIHFLYYSQYIYLFIYIHTLSTHNIFYTHIILYAFKALWDKRLRKFLRIFFITGLSHSRGQKWHTNAWKKHIRSSPGQTFKKYIAQSEKSKERRKKYIRRRLFAPKPKTDHNYGPNAKDVDESVLGKDLKEACLLKLKDFETTIDQIKYIESATIGQHDNDVYTTYRCDRLTASQFGMICKRKSTTPCHNQVKSVLYKNNILTNDMAYGQNHESVARTLFIEKMNKAVRPAGLYIDEEFGFLGASPDGVIEEENSILEIKCFPSLARNNQDIFSAAKDRKNFPLLVDDTGALQINKKHNYYYQIQGQLRVSKMMKCYFIGYVSPSFDITVLEVQRDENFIKNMMPKLVTFYKNCILPEVVLRRVTKKQKCIDISIMW